MATTQKSSPTLNALPDDLIVQILRYLPLDTQHSLSMVSRRFRTASLPVIFTSIRARTRGDTFRLFQALGRVDPPTWIPFVKSLKIDIPLWEVSQALPRSCKWKTQRDPEQYTRGVLMSKDYIGILANLERIEFNHTSHTEDELMTIDYILRTQKLNALKHFVYKSVHAYVPGLTFSTLDDFVHRHSAHLVTLELPISVVISPNHIHLDQLVKYSGSPVFFNNIIRAPRLTHVKFLVVPKFAAREITRAVRALATASLGVRVLRCDLGNGLNMEYIEAAACNLRNLEVLQVKWHVDNSFNSKV
ncbi:hypothetical protein ONZ45_g16557 [Pleurotus djamor]|nr:hypothetical protein ONZ45_g16557 [Pleurotus djamor]